MNYMGGWWLPFHEGEYAPPPDQPVERFCPDPECACSARGVEGMPCWQCGGETTSQRPKWWPFAGANQTVIGGNSWTVGEGDDEVTETAA